MVKPTGIGGHYQNMTEKLEKSDGTCAWDASSASPDNTAGLSLGVCPLRQVSFDTVNAGLASRDD